MIYFNTLTRISRSLSRTVLCFTKYYIIYINALTRIPRSLSRTALCFIKYYIICINALTRISRSLSRTALWSYEILYYLHQCAVAHITFAIANCLMFLLNIILFTSMRSRTYHVRYRELPYGLMKYYIICINALSRISRSLSRTALCFIKYYIIYINSFTRTSRSLSRTTL